MTTEREGIKTLGVGLLGLGTVGSGVVRLLEENQSWIQRRLGVRLSVVRAARRRVAQGGPPGLDPACLTPDPMEVVRDPRVEIVVELTGQVDPARDWILEAFRLGKSVVTANKAVLATWGESLFEAAAAARTDLFFEASVAGGIPIIQVLRESLAGNRILSLHGIVNGTSNYILTRMSEEGLEFEPALREAQARGYAEADPSLDVEGVDAAHKLAILITLLYGTPVHWKEIYVEGIQHLATLDIQFALELGYHIRLLAITRPVEGGVEARVHPTLIPRRHPLAQVRGVFNALYLVGDALGPCLLYGKGAGARPTASAVLGDLVAAARNRLFRAQGRIPPAGFLPEGRTRIPILPMEEVRSHYYFRFMVLDRPGVLSRISGILGAHEISIASVIQKGREEGGVVPLVMLTHEAREQAVRRALEEIDRLPVVSGKTVLLRVEEWE